jgi:hypothetical protein
MRCEVIRDLIPLYEEDLCSQASGELVEEHVAGCGECRALLLDQGGMLSGKVSKLDGESRQHARGKEGVELNRKALQPFRKVKRAYNLRILLAMLLIPFLVFGYAEISGNSLVRVLKGNYMAERYFSSLVSGDHGKAVRYLDFSGGRYGKEGVPLEGAEVRYVEALDTLKEMGIRFTDFDITPDAYNGIRNDDGFASGYVEVGVEKDGQDHRFLFWVSAQGRKLDIGWIQEMQKADSTVDTEISSLLGDFLSTYYPG